MHRWPLANTLNLQLFSVSRLCERVSSPSYFSTVRFTKKRVVAKLSSFERDRFVFCMQTSCLDLSFLSFAQSWMKLSRTHPLDEPGFRSTCASTDTSSMRSHFLADERKFPSPSRRPSPCSDFPVRDTSKSQEEALEKCLVQVAKSPIFEDWHRNRIRKNRPKRSTCVQMNELASRDAKNIYRKGT